MKILMVNKFFRIVGGSDTYCFALSEALKKSGHEVIFFSMKDDRNWPDENEKYFVENIDYETNNPIKKAKYAIKYIYSFEAKRKIGQLLDYEKPDIVHLNHIHHQITLSVVDEIKKRNIPMVFTLHDVICACPNYMMFSHGKVCEKCIQGDFINCIKERCVKDSLSKSILAAVESWNYRRMNVYDDIDAYIAPSDFYRKKLAESKFTKRPIYHFKNMLPVGTVYGQTKEREDYILFFGRLSKEKGILTLIQAVEKMKQKKSLCIVGDGPLRNELETYCLEHNIQGRVTFLGYKSGKELEDIVRKAKCVVLASEWYENGPYAIAEASAYGTPCIVSDMGGLPETVIEGYNGYICEAGNVDSLSSKIDAIYQLNNDAYARMCYNAAVKAEIDYNPQNYLDKIVGLYQSLIKEKRGKKI